MYVCIVHVPHIICRGTANTDTNTIPTPACMVLLLLLMLLCIPRDQISRIDMGVCIIFFSFWKFFKSEILNLAMLALWEKKIIPPANFSLRSFFSFLFQTQAPFIRIVFLRTILDLLILVIKKIFLPLYVDLRQSHPIHLTVLVYLPIPSRMTNRHRPQKQSLNLETLLQQGRPSQQN